ncbi:hypothetical protein, partial [Treponema sp.]|uniref:hypothetical protein n=1 Tax=Treponema sp. TaxID=166 RepID=UPI00298EB612
MRRWLRNTGFFLVCTALNFSFISCELFNKGVKSYLEYYTETSAIEKKVITDSIGKSSFGIDCIESNEDKKINFYLRNPQGYRITCQYDFDHPEIADAYPNFLTDGSLVFTQTEDRNSITLTFSQSFLNALEMGSVDELDSEGNPTGKKQKDLSGTIHIFESETLREFIPCHVSVTVNTAPPRIRGAVVQRDKTQDQENGQFVICFNIPILKNTVHEKDTTKLYIGSELYTLNFSTSSVTVRGDDGGQVKLSTTAPANLYNIDNSAQTFVALSPSSDGCIPLYYMTGIDPNAAENANIRNTITLADDYGFSKTVSVSSQTDQLNPVQINVVSGESYYADENSGKFNLVISHDRTSTRTTVNGLITGEMTPEMPQIVYEVFKSGETSAIASGTKTAPVSIPLEKGKYYVKAYACYNAFIDSTGYSGFASKQTADDLLTVYRRAAYYVNANGAANGNGSRNNPYNSIQKCIDEIRSDAVTEFFDEGYNIYLQSDLTGTDTDFVEQNKKALAYFYKGSEITSPEKLKITVNGNGHKLDAARSEQSSVHGRVMYVNGSDVQVVLDNVKICGGYSGSDQNGAGIYIKGSEVTVKNGTSITQNNAKRGAGIYISAEVSNSILNLYGATITGNTATETGAGIYYGDGTVNIQNTNTVNSNYLSDGTTGSNFYIACDKTVNITGAVTDSLIKIAKNYTSATRPDVGAPVAFTSGYAYALDGSGTNTDLPGKVFKCDVTEGTDSYPVIEEGGEAAFAKAGAGVYTALDFNFDFEMNRADEADGKHKFYVGHKKVFTVTPVVKLGNTDLTFVESRQSVVNGTTKFYEINGQEAKITWSAKLLCGSELTGSRAPSVSDNQITIPNTLMYTDTFTLHVTATYMGIPHSKDFTIYGIEPPQAVSNMTDLQSAIDNMTGTELTVLATAQFTDMTFNVPQGKTVTIIRSDDIPLNQPMFLLSNEVSFGGVDSGNLVLDGDNTIGTTSLVKSYSYYYFNMTIKNYTNKNNGGALAVRSSSNYLRMYNCTFENCHAKNGGAIDLPCEAVGSPVDGIVSCTFTNCTAVEKGGAIYAHT